MRRLRSEDGPPAPAGGPALMVVTGELTSDVPPLAAVPLVTSTDPVAAVHASPPTPAGAYARWCKPACDRLLAAVLLVLFLPLLLAVSLVVLLSLGRPVFFRQWRIGRDGEPFRIWKFRTMRHDRRCRSEPVPCERRTCHKRADDPRHTPAGRVLRQWRLDELPQLLNVLGGTMSLVGPRPELAELVARYEPWQHDRHLVKPGITGLWQVRSASAPGMMHQNTELDIEYVERLSPALDASVIVSTVAVMLARRGQ